MDLKIYNTLTRKKEVFKPGKNKQINLFVCGPTVYDLPHIGHAKTYIQFDVIVKYLRSKNYSVFYLQNITDLDDKIIKRAKQQNTTPLKLAREFEKYYHQDEKKLKINSVTKYARATDYINPIVKQVKTLIKKGYAYKTSDGYYYDIKKFKDYGKLSKRTALGAEDAVSRIDEGIEKRNKGDFCLWKFSKPDEPSWNTDLGRGRPGWHIEDTAITETEFGPQYDIHGGARDLIFPHHEAEIAQIEAISGKKPMVKYWMHTGFLTVSGKKMSKSLKNFITVRETLKKHNSNTLRFLYSTSHYRRPIDFSESSLEKAQNSLKRLNNFAEKAQNGKQDDASLVKKTQKKFEKAMNNDFDTPTALAAIFDFIKKANKNNKAGPKSYNLLKDINEVFDFFSFTKEKIPQKVLELADQREQARNQKHFEKADKIRKQIHKLGYQVKDTSQGPQINKT